MYGEGAVTGQMCQKWLIEGFMLGIFCWMILQGWVDQLKSIVIKLRHSLRTVDVTPRGR